MPFVHDDKAPPDTARNLVIGVCITLLLGRLKGVELQRVGEANGAAKPNGLRRSRLTLCGRAAAASLDSHEHHGLEIDQVRSQASPRVNVGLQSENLDSLGGATTLSTSSVRCIEGLSGSIDSLVECLLHRGRTGGKSCIQFSLGMCKDRIGSVDRLIVPGRY